MKTFVAALILFVASIASAQPPGLTPPSTTPMSALADSFAPPPVAHKSKSVALWTSLGATVGGAVLLGIGVDSANHNSGSPSAGAYNALAVAGAGAFLVGPSLGRIYARRDGWNTGLKLRLGSVPVLGLGFVTLVACALASEDGGQGNSGVCTTAGIALVGGGAMYIGGAAYEIATSGRAVERYNRDQDRGVEARLTLTPLKTRDGGTTPGLAVVGSF
jgi:hypothetical protein